MCHQNLYIAWQKRLSLHRTLPTSFIRVRKHVYCVLQKRLALYIHSRHCIMLHPVKSRKNHQHSGFHHVSSHIMIVSYPNIIQYPYCAMKSLSLHQAVGPFFSRNNIPGCILVVRSTWVTCCLFRAFGGPPNMMWTLDVLKLHEN